MSQEIIMGSSDSSSSVINSKLKMFPGILECRFCNGRLMLSQNEDKEALLFCKACNIGYPVKNGTLYFDSIPEDLAPKTAASELTDTKKWSQWRTMSHKYLENQLGKIDKESIIAELGAGRRKSRELFYRFDKYIAIDIYPFDGIDIVSNLTKKFPFSSNSIDVAISSNTLEHISDPMLYLAEAARILKPGGVLIMTVPFLFKIHQMPYDFYRFTRYGLEHMLVNNGNLFLEEMKELNDISESIRVIKNCIYKNVAQNSSSAKKLFQKVAILADKFAFKILMNSISENDCQDYSLVPQGYGCVARKRR